MFSIPEGLGGFSREGLQDLIKVGKQELASIRASITDPETVSDEVLESGESVQASIARVEAELAARDAKAARTAALNPVEPVVAAVEQPPTPEVPVKDATATTSAPAVAGAPTTIIAATTTLGTSIEQAPARSVQVADVAPLAPAAAIPEGEASQWVIRASSDVPGYQMGAELTMDDLGKAFKARTTSYGKGSLVASRGFAQHGIAQIERQYKPEYVLDNGSDLAAYQQLNEVTKRFNTGEDSVTAGIAWCSPSTVDYSTCSPIEATGLFQAPEVLAPRGGIRHNQGLSFNNFFNDDTVLPIPGYNILTEAQVISDTAKTCLTIPCPSFVDDRLNVSALCLTGNILQNVAYPEFVSEFVSGSLSAMAHLVNREIINEIVTGSTAVNLTTVDPWQGPVASANVVATVLSAAELAAVDLRYFYRTSETATVAIVLPIWIRAQMRADWLRRNGFTNGDDLADAAIAGFFARRNISVQYVYDWQDSFNPGALTAGFRAGETGVAVTNRTFDLPNTVAFLAFLPGTWVVARQNVIRLDSVYDSTKLATNQVTQLFLEDGYKPMKMCAESRVYTVNIAPTGTTGAQVLTPFADLAP